MREPEYYSATFERAKISKLDGIESGIHALCIVLIGCTIAICIFV